MTLLNLITNRGQKKNNVLQIVLSTVELVPSSTGIIGGQERGRSPFVVVRRTQTSRAKRIKMYAKNYVLYQYVENLFTVLHTENTLK